jgi:hypothetical protein
LNKKGAGNLRVKQAESEAFFLLPEEAGSIVMLPMIFLFRPSYFPKNRLDWVQKRIEGPDYAFAYGGAL